MKGKSMDWFKFYPADYRDDTWDLDLAAHGAYMLLIQHYMMHEKPLPDNDKALASIVGVGLDEWSAVASQVRNMFVTRDGKLRHKRCELELNAAYDRRRDGAERAAKYRKTKESVTHDERVSNTPRGEERRGEDICFNFDDFWEQFPRQRRGNKQKALRAYKRAISEKRATEAEILDGLKIYAVSKEVVQGYAKGAESWLNDDRWAHEYETTKKMGAKF